MLLKYVFIFVFVARGLIYAQSIPQKFIDALIYDKPEIIEYVNKDELKRSERLGIEYDGVKNKFLIGGDIPAELKEDIKSGKYKYEATEKPLADTYTEVTFKVPDASYSKVLYFQNGFITTSAYRSHLWEKAESKYFSNRLQEPKYFNDYCKRRLDEFVDMVADTLGFTISEKRILEKEKIIYTFYADENEVESITGFKAKGIAMLGSDEIVTSYQTHFHEVAHLLINYKLKKLGLYTLPFFMEGFAVAVGGRGGMAPRVVTDIGAFLQTTKFLTYDSILTNEQFYNNDANMTYALAGLYNSFLLSEIGSEKYVSLYREMNGSLDQVRSIITDEIKLPSHEKFQGFLDTYNEVKILYVDEKDTSKIPVSIDGSAGSFIKSGEYIKFFSTKKYKIGFGEVSTDRNYISRKYEELYKNNNYSNSKYCIIVDEKTVDIYNLFNDELIFSYNKGLAITQLTLPKKNMFYKFFIKEKVFEDNFFDKIIIIDTN